MDKNKIYLERTVCCDAEIRNNGIIKDEFVCEKCGAKAPATYPLQDWKPIAPNVFAISVVNGWIYDIQGEKTYPGGSDITHNIIFIHA